MLGVRRTDDETIHVISRQRRFQIAAVFGTRIVGVALATIGYIVIDNGDIAVIVVGYVLQESFGVYMCCGQQAKTDHSLSPSEV